MRARLVALALVAVSPPAFAADPLAAAHKPALATPVGVFDYQKQQADQKSQDGQPAQADSDASGAGAIEDAYAAYFSRAAIAKGIIAVKPDGDGFVVTWDLQKAFDAVDPASPSPVQIEPFGYHIKPEANGGWSWSGDALPKFTIDAKTENGPSKGAVAFEGVSVTGRFDPTSEPFLTNKITIGAMMGDIAETDPSGENHIKFLQKDMSAEARGQTDSAGGVDLGLVHAIGSISQIVTPPGADPGGDLDIKFNSDGSGGGAAITHLRAREIGTLWRALVASANDGKAPDNLAELVMAALPLWNDMGGDVRLKDLRVASAVGSAGVVGFGEKLKLSGLTDEGRVEFGLEIDGLTIDSPIAPPWTAQLSPLSANLALALTDTGVGEAVRLALKDPKFGQSGDLAAETQAAINNAIKAGDPKILLLPGHLKTPVIDVAFEGSARVDANSPSAQMKLSVDSLDKLLDLATELGKADPEVQTGVLGLSLAKGLAKTDADGRLVWDIVMEGDKVTVNGSPLPTGK